LIIAVGYGQTMENRVSTEIRNYRLCIWNGIIFQNTFPFIDGTMIIPLFLSSLTQSQFIIGLAGALMLAGSSLPQILAAHQVDQTPRRLDMYLKTGWIRLSALLLLVLTVFSYRILPSVPILLWGSILFLSLLQLSTAFSTLAFLEIVRTSMPVTHRGRLWGYRRFFGGFGVLALAPLISLILSKFDYPVSYGIMFIFVLILTAAGIYIFSFVEEKPYVPPTAGRRLAEYLRSTLRDMRGEPRYAWISISQLMAGIWTMTLPFYIVFARNVLNMPEADAGWFIASQMMGKITSNMFWAYLDDRFSSRVIYHFVPLPSLLAAGAIALITPATPNAFLILMGAFFMMGVALTGFDIGFTNMTLDLADTHGGAGALGVMNTVNAVFSFLPMLGGILIDFFGFQSIFLLSMTAAVAVWPVSLRLIPRMPSAALHKTL
jgi:MFS family permease